MDFEDVRQTALTLTEVADSSTAQGFALKHHGKLIACEAINKSAEPDSLMVVVGFDKREALIGMEPEIYYVTHHYLKTPGVLIRLSGIDAEALRGVLMSACDFVNVKDSTGRTRKA